MMKVEHINPIYTAAKEVFSNMFGWGLEKGDLRIEENIISNNKANISIGITGDLRGTILFSFPENMALKIVEEMAGMEFNEIDKFVASAIGELANIISGNAMNNFYNNKYTCDIVPPQITIGENKTFTTASKNVLVIPLNTDIGDFELYISVSEHKIN